MYTICTYSSVYLQVYLTYRKEPMIIDIACFTSKFIITIILFFMLSASITDIKLLTRLRLKGNYRKKTMDIFSRTKMMKY